MGDQDHLDLQDHQVCQAMEVVQCSLVPRDHLDLVDLLVLP